MIRTKDVFERRRARWSDCAERWKERAAARREHLVAIHRREDADTVERIASFARREAARPSTPAVVREAVRAAARASADDRTFTRLFEGKVGPTLDWSYAPSGATARTAARPVARLCARPQSTREAGFATGFLVSSRLLLTNHHVFQTAGEARDTFAQFGYEQSGGQLAPGVFFQVDPDSFFLSDRRLDLALVAVVPQSVDGARDLVEMGQHRLLGETSKILIGHPITIIQHPDGGPRTFADRQNRLIDVLTDYLHYSTDTLPGSSGSPCFNRFWEVVALHHCGIPQMRGQDVVTTDGRVWDGVDLADVAWDANEGIRATVVRKHLLSELPSLDAPSQALLREVLEGPLPQRGPDTPSLPPDSPPPHSDASPGEPHEIRLDPDSLPATDEARPMPQHTININGEHATVYISCTVHKGPVTQPTVPTPPPPGALERRIRFDTNYDNRSGYDPDFLGIHIPLPTVRPERQDELLTGIDGKPLVVPYRHFSLVVNQDRFLQMWSAVNVDYSPAMRVHAQSRDAFGDDFWASDPRVPDEHILIDQDFYKPAKRVDRGHIVRREDNAWGATFEETEYANSDTFHWTNCTPQHERFNQSRVSGRWGELEDQIKAESQAQAPRLSIFAGPVLADDDPVALGIQYPVKFWKVIAAVVDGKLAAYGFVLDQSRVVKRSGLGLEGLDLSLFRAEQTSLADIEALSGVKLAKVLNEADVLLGDPTPIDLLDPNESIRLRRKPSADPVGPAPAPAPEPPPDPAPAPAPAA